MGKYALNLTDFGGSLWEHAAVSYQMGKQPENDPMERVFNMILRTLINKGVNFGIKAASNRGRKTNDNTPESGQTSRQDQKGPGGLRQAGRVLRRMGRF